MIEFNENDLVLLYNNVEGKELGDESIQPKPFRLGVKKPFSFEALGAVFTLDAFALGEIQVFNSSDDKDEDSIFGIPSTDNKEEMELRPQVVYSGDSAHVKLKVKAGLKGKGGSDLKSIGFNLSGEKSVALSSYSKHKRNAPAKETIIKHLKSPRLITRPDHIKNLEPNEALSMQIYGSLKGGLKYETSDLFTLGLGSISSLFNLDTELPLVIDIDAGLKLSVGFELKDSFRIIFSNPKNPRDGFRKVAVKKDRSSEVTGTFKAGLSIKFQNEDQLAEVVDSVVDGLLGKPLEKVNEILDKVNLDKLLEEQEGLSEEITFFLDQLMERLKLNEYNDKLEKLKEEVNKFPDKVKDKIKEIVKNKIELGFLYEYHRVRTEEALFEAWLTEAAVEKYHKDLIQNNLSKFKDISNADGVEIETFLREKTFTLKKAWGFTLGIGKWSFGGKDYKEKKWVERKNRKDGTMLVNFLGGRGYKGSWLKNKFEWNFDLNAGIDEFKDADSVNAGTLDYRFYLSMSNSGNLKTEAQEDLFDLAVLWNAAPEDDLTEIWKELQSKIDGKPVTEWALHLSIDPSSDLTGNFLKAISENTVQNLCYALGAAMPLWKGFNVREDRELRRAVYGALWEWYIKNPTQNYSDLAETIGYNIKRLAKPKKPGNNTRKLAFNEKHLGKKYFIQTFVGLAKHNENTPRQVFSCAKGIQKLYDNNESYKVVEKAFGRIDDFCTQSHHLRALGVFLTDMANSVSPEKPFFDSSFNVKYKSGDKVKLLSINRLGIHEKE